MNGVVAVPGTQVDPNVDVILLDGKPIQVATAHVYLMLHKPEGALTTADDPQGRPTIFDLLPEEMRPPLGRCFSVGRLDADSSGLLLVTTDGDWAYRITHPSFVCKKKYIARVQGVPSEDAMKAFRAGLDIDGKRTAPCEIELIKKERDARVCVTLHEGRNRQVRKMLLAIGHRVITLKRVEIGGVRLGALPKGQWRLLTTQEINQLG